MLDPNLEAKRVDDLEKRVEALSSLNNQNAERITDLEAIKSASDDEIDAFRDFRRGAGAWIEARREQEAEERTKCADCGLGHAKWWDGQKALLCRPCVERRLVPAKRAAIGSGACGRLATKTRRFLGVNFDTLSLKIVATVLLAFSALLTVSGAMALGALLLGR